MSFQDENGVQDFTSYNENSDPIDSDQLVFVPEIIKGSLTYNQYMQQHESEKIRDEASREGSGRLEAVLDGAGDQGISASLNNMNPAAVDSTGDQGISVNSPLNNMQPGAVDTTGGQGISPVDTTGDQGISSADTTGDQGISPSADNLSTDGSSTPNVVHDSNLQDNQGIPTSFVTQDTENFDQVTIPLEESTGSAGTNEAPLEEGIPNADNPEESIDDQTPISDSIDSSANVDESQVDANGSMGIPRHEYVLEGKLAVE
ncbi:hypothetical protein O9G_000550 [Rozella allomycis CSF55]|uniref:Uncharacterized protein n=1 Tax=Rozella allomycis (strain CSF55) TaxID=988480 RepID=A0A075AVL1_ROZAC|nr:hypothetical protein O9G_000550 [Rozella allomycis CSF55]|eukprot:EPZ34363.1 hypothetical protein O9G_000550 [Rozella allomycis CSF55]